MSNRPVDRHLRPGLATALAGQHFRRIRQQPRRSEIALATPLAAKNQNRLAGPQFALVSARVAPASDQPQSSRPQLEQAVKGSRRNGFLPVEWESLLSPGRAGEKSGHLAAAQSQVRASGQSRPRQRPRIDRPQGGCDRVKPARRTRLPAGRGKSCAAHCLVTSMRLSSAIRSTSLL
jgi:hypothetical protein